MKIASVETNSSSRAVEVQWSDGCTLHYPFVWLRDNCQCQECFHPGIRARLLLFRNVDPLVLPSDVKAGNGKQLSVTWPDGHQSDYRPDWLYKRGFGAQEPPKHIPELDKKPPKFWGSELQDNVPTMQFDEVLTDDGALFRWLCHLEETGIVLLQGAPQHTGQVARLANRVSQLFYTYHGTTFHVKVKPTPISPAYTAATLGLHSDLCSLEYMPGMQMLHCIAQAKAPGGENPLVDAFFVAKQMEREYPDMYKLLTTVPLYFSDIGKDAYDFIIAAQHTSIQLNASGELERVYCGGHLRESIQNHLPLDVIQPLYTAMCKFEELLMHPHNCILLKTRPGEIICFDNYRVLHARTSYVLKEGEERHLEGGYISWDDLLSKRRVLENQLSGVNCDVEKIK